MKFEEVIKQYGEDFVPPQCFCLYYITEKDGKHYLQKCPMDTSRGQEIIDKREEHPHFLRWCTYEDMNAKFVFPESLRKMWSQ